MKSVRAIIPERNFDAVNDALHKLGISGLTVYNSKGRGKEPPRPNQMGHWFYFSEFGDNSSILILAKDEDVGKITDAIRENANVGKIFVSQIEDLIDIKNNTRGEEAL